MSYKHKYLTSSILSLFWSSKNKPQNVKEITQRYNSGVAKRLEITESQMRNMLNKLINKGVIKKSKSSSNRVQYQLKEKYSKKYNIIDFPKNKDLSKYARYKKLRIKSNIGLNHWLKDMKEAYHNYEIEDMKKQLKSGKSLMFDEDGYYLSNIS